MVSFGMARPRAPNWRGVPNVVVLVAEEAAQQVDGKDAQALLGLNLHDGQDRLVENGVADVLSAVRVGRHLRNIVANKNVVSPQC